MLKEWPGMRVSLLGAALLTASLIGVLLSYAPAVVGVVMGGLMVWAGLIETLSKSDAARLPPSSPNPRT